MSIFRTFSPTSRLNARSPFQICIMRQVTSFTPDLAPTRLMPFPTVAVNIHSHLWGAVLFAYFCGTFYSSYIKPFTPVATWHDSAVFLIYLLSAVVCLFSSALYHTSGCHSEKVLLFACNRVF